MTTETVDSGPVDTSPRPDCTECKGVGFVVAGPKICSCVSDARAIQLETYLSAMCVSLSLFLDLEENTRRPGPFSDEAVAGACAVLRRTFVLLHPKDAPARGRMSVTQCPACGEPIFNGKEFCERYACIAERRGVTVSETELFECDMADSAPLDEQDQETDEEA